MRPLLAQDLVGIEADTDVTTVAFTLCRTYGGADPIGEQLVKKRKVSTCTYCGLRVKGNDHSKCKEKREAAVDEFRTPVAQVLHSVACKPFETLVPNANIARSVVTRAVR